ncbi:MAG: N,N-dimethylformamidase beta subunit family domain-containing protein [Actinomycetes bacterium]
MGSPPQLPTLSRRSFLSLLAAGAAAGLAACSPSSGNSGADGAAPSEPPAPAGAKPTRAWFVKSKNAAPASLIEGYTGQTSVLPGQPVNLHVSTSASQWGVEVFRIGYYDGLGGIRVASAGPFPGHKGAAASSSTGGAAVANWPVSAQVSTEGWAPGFYLLHLIANGRRIQLPLVVRSETARDAVAVVVSATTWQAYNLWGDRSLYRSAGGAFEGRSSAVSFDRPYGDTALTLLNAFEIPIVRVAEESGVPLAWFANTDIALDPPLLEGALAAVSTGHDEYWPPAYRQALVSLRDGGGNLAFLGANAGYWRVRLSDPGSGPGRLMTCYKDAGADPVKGPTATARWRDNPNPAPENQVIGQLYDAFPVDGPMVIRDPDFFLFADTGVRAGTELGGLIGPEIDRVYDLRTTPRPIQVPALSPVTCRGKQTWSTVAYYTTESGAGVFSTGTMGWSRSLPRPERMATISAAAKAFTHKVTINVFRAIATPGLGRQHPADDQLEQVHLPTTNTSGAA